MGIACSPIMCIIIFNWKHVNRSLKNSIEIKDLIHAFISSTKHILMGYPGLISAKIIMIGNYSGKKEKW